MKPIYERASKPFCGVTAILCAALLLPCNAVALAQETEEQTAAPAEAAPKIPNDQLDSLVAPIALYPDPLLGQTLAASTYPLEIIQLQQWMDRNKSLKGQKLADAVQKQPWDPSVQAMAPFPDVTKRLAGNIQWTTDLGNAFLAQQSDVMDAVQRMREKAQSKGALKSSAEQKVETQTVEGKQVIVVQQANPEVVYVPSYDPVVVYGAPAYPYPSYYYPGYVPGMALAFGTGLALGAAWGGGWGWGCGWGNGDVTINNGNRYVNHYNRNNVNNINNINRGQGGNKWQHRPEHRGNAPYGDRGTANRFGGGARQQPARGAGANRPGSGTGANRPGGGLAANRPGGGTGVSRPGGGTGANRPGGGLANNRPGGGTGANRPATGAGNRPGGGAGIGAGGNRPSTMPSTRPAGGANRIGNQNLGGSSRGGGGSRAGGGSPSFSSRGGGFGGGGGGSAARASSSRGGRSMGGGGMSRGGGGGGRRGR